MTLQLQNPIRSHIGALSCHISPPHLVFSAIAEKNKAELWTQITGGHSLTQCGTSRCIQQAICVMVTSILLVQSSDCFSTFPNPKMDVVWGGGWWRGGRRKKPGRGLKASGGERRGRRLLPEDEWLLLCLLAPHACVWSWTGLLERSPTASHAQVDKLHLFSQHRRKTHHCTVWATADTVEVKQARLIKEFSFSSA